LRRSSGPNRSYSFSARSTSARVTRSQATMYSFLQHCGAKRGTDCVLDDINDGCWFGNASYVIDGMHFYLRIHPFRHVALRLRDYHSIIFGNKKPTRNGPPQRAPDRNRDAKGFFR
jgi:hypothetical protein